MSTVPAEDRRDSLIAIVLYGAIVAGLHVVPRLVPIRRGVISAAAAEGYNTDAAFWTTVVWAAVTVLVFALRQRTIARADPPAHAPATGHLEWGVLTATFALFAAAYCPLFLGRYGPYMEDIYFLSAIDRMDCGQLPYRDFAFLYGPLMIYPVAAWSQLFGASMASYYSFLALLEGVQFALLMGVLQYLVPSRRYQYLVFVLLMPFLFNTLLGLNYNGMRWLAPTLVIVLAAHRPYGLRENVLCGTLLGIHLAYSHEYAIAGLAALIGMYAVTFLLGERAASVRAASTVAAVSAVTWLSVAAVVLRASFPSYIEHAREVVGMMSSGHAGFQFYWTANSLALFGLLTIACVAIGKGLALRAAGALLAADRLMIGALVFALVLLKSGLTRSDHWHLNAGFLALFLAVLLPLPVGRMGLTASARRTALWLVAVASLTYVVGIAPTGSLYASSYLRGLRDTLSGTRTSLVDATRSGSIEFERTQPRADIVALGRYLAEPERADRPVLFYGRAWALPHLVGVCPQDYKLDDLMYTEFNHPEAAYLRDHPDALVVMRRDDYWRLYHAADASASAPRVPLTPMKQLGRWLSTPHYDSTDLEGRLQDETRERLTGSYIRSTYRRAAEFGDNVVLASN